MSAVTRITQGLGIVTDPSALEAGLVPKGAMRQADNVLLHRSGAIQPRPGFGDVTGIEPRSGVYYPIAIVPYEAQGWHVVQSWNGSSYKLEWLHEDLNITTTSALAAPPDVDQRGRSAFIEARGSVYHTGASGVRKLCRDSTTVYERAGLWQTYQPISHSLVDAGASSDRMAIDSTAADSTVGYRWLVRREDERGYVQRGPAGSRSLITATMSGYANGAYNNLNGNNPLTLPEDAAAGDVIEVYRTPNAPGDPGDDYYLCATYTITAADITTGWIVSEIEDSVTDDNLGVALYSSSSQLGALASKQPPPHVNHLAWWKGVAWAANGTERHAVRATLTKVAYESTTDRLEGLGLCHNETMTGDFASGSPTVTGVTFGTDVEPNLNGGSLVGMWINGSSPSHTDLVPAGTTITAISGAGPYTLTMSANAVATASSESFQVGDVLTVDGVDFYFYDVHSPAARWIGLSNDAALATRVYDTSVNIAEAVAFQYGAGTIGATCIKDEILSGGDGELLFVAGVADPAGAFTVSCESRPSAWAEAEIEAGITAPDATHRDWLWWSAPDEPSAWPPANFTRVGETSGAILAIVPLNDALLVFKQDGIYRVSGSPPDSWVVDRIDSTKRLVAPEAVCVLDGIAYAWTDRGVVRVTEGGVLGSVSDAIAHTLREYQRALPRGVAGHKRGIWAQAHSRLGLVLLNVGGPTDTTPSGGQYVLHVNSGAWSHWTRTSDTCSAYDPTEDRLLVGWGTGAWAALYERSDEDAPESYRDQLADDVVPASWTSTSVAVLTKADVPWTPTTCDVLEHRSGTYHAITAVADTGATWTLTVSPAVSATSTCEYYLLDELGGYIVDESGGRIVLSTGTCSVDLHEAITATMLWQTQHLPGRGSRWQEIHAQLLDGSSAYLDEWDIALGGATENTSQLSVTATIDADVTLSRPVRVGVPRDIVRAAHVYPYARVCEAGVLWRLGELEYHHTPEGRRVRR